LRLARGRFASGVVALTEVVGSYLGVSAGRGSLLCLGEPVADPLSEAELSLLWAGQRFPPEALTTPDGRPVTVLNPGRRSSGPGPDFRDAIVAVDGCERRGDVELHVRASYFQEHGHFADPAYAALALHVVYLADDGLETSLFGGGTAPVAALAPWLSQRKEELARWLSEWDIWVQPCRRAVWRVGDEAIDAVLRQAGETRFLAKAQKLGAMVDEAGEEEALWRALLDALGVGGDREAFRRLALRLPVARAAGIADLFQDDDPAGALTAALIDALDVDPRAVAPSRPANRPERRLAALAQLYLRARGDLASFVREGVDSAAKPGQLVERWCVGPDGTMPLGRSQAASLLGPERARELVVNVALPFAALDPSLRDKALSLLASMPPAPAYSKTGFLESNLRRADGKRRVRSVLEQQGLLSLLGDWCSQGGCGRCPLSPPA
jgi:hypothetical protein